MIPLDEIQKDKIIDMILLDLENIKELNEE